MVAAVGELGRVLVAWAEDHPEASLAEHEAGVLEAVRTALPRLRRVVVAQSTRALAAIASPGLPRSPGCVAQTPEVYRTAARAGHPVGLVQRAPRSWHMVFGPLLLGSFQEGEPRLTRPPAPVRLP